MMVEYLLGMNKAPGLSPVLPPKINNVSVNSTITFLLKMSIFVIFNYV